MACEPQISSDVVFSLQRGGLRAATNFGRWAIPITDLPALRVLIVDDEPAARKVLAVVLAQNGFLCETAASGEEALRLLKEKPVDALISDLRMPGVSGMELLAKVRKLYPHLVFLMVTGVNDIRVGIQAMQQGADDYLVKPFQVDANVVSGSLARNWQKKRLEQEVERYRHHLEELVAEQTQQLRSALSQIERGYEHTLEAMGAAIDLRDSGTAGHSRRVFRYSVELAQAMGGLEQELRNIAMGAWLHDIGKLGIPDAILLKPGPLTDEERKIMQEHASIGYELIKGIPFLVEAAEIILRHHERYDGSGYPGGLKGEEIPIGARIFSIADTVDAMTSDRPYRRALPFEAARETIERGAGKLYDPQVAKTFLGTSNEIWEEIRGGNGATRLSPASAAGDFQFLNRLVKSGTPSGK